MGEEYRSLLPEIATLATEASTIAIKAVTASVQALLGSDAELSDSINRRIDQLGQRLKEEIELRQRMGHYQQLEQLGESLDAELEAMVDELVANLDGKTLLTSLFQVLSADEEELSDLELRIDMLEQDLEWQLEQQSEALAKAAKQVCDRIEQLDKLEAQLQNQLPAYQGIDLIVPPNAD
jgi:chromosome segregation ATPase